MGSNAVKRILAAGLFTLLAAASQAQNPSWGPTYWNGTAVPTLGQIPDYTTFHDAAKMFRTPCDVPGPGSWQDLCDQMVLNLMALLPSVTPGGSDTVMLIHNGALSTSTVTALAVGGGSGAPDDAEYVTGATNVTLSAERVGTSSTSITWDFGTAGQAKVKRAALTGDVTASADSNATTIADAAVTLAKMANVATDTIFCRDTTGTGVPEICTLGASLAFTSANVLGRAALTGDVTASANSNATTIANGAVTFAKMADMATDTLIGRQSGTGAPEAISVSGGLEWTTNAIQTSAFTGDVTKSAGGTATTIANLAVAEGMLQDNAVTFAKMQNLTGDGVLLGRDSAGSGDPQEITLGAGLFFSTHVLNTTSTWVFDKTTKTTTTTADYGVIADAAAANANKKTLLNNYLPVQATLTTPSADVCSLTANTFSFTVPGGALSTSSGYQVDMVGKFANGTGSATTDGITIEAKYDDTVLASDVLATSSSNGKKMFNARIILTGYASTSKEFAMICASQQATDAATTGIGTLDTTPSASQRCVATNFASLPADEDSTTDKTFTITIVNTFNHSTACNQIGWAKVTRIN